MSNLKQWVLQMRYPYTAGVIALIWIGSALLAIIRPEVAVQPLMLFVALATLVIAVVGFTSAKH